MLGRLRGVNWRMQSHAHHTYRLKFAYRLGVRVRPLGGLLAPIPFSDGSNGTPLRHGGPRMAGALPKGPDRSPERGTDTPPTALAWPAAVVSTPPERHKRRQASEKGPICVCNRGGPPRQRGSWTARRALDWWFGGEGLSQGCISNLFRPIQSRVFFSCPSSCWRGRECGGGCASCRSLGWRRCSQPV